MFDLFSRRSAKDYLKDAEDIYKMPETTRSTNKEMYRVGYNSVDQLTTLTLMGDNGFSMTLSLNQSGCEQMIRMLRATYAEEKDTTNVIN